MQPNFFGLFGWSWNWDADRKEVFASGYGVGPPLSGRGFQKLKVLFEDVLLIRIIALWGSG